MCYPGNTVKTLFQGWGPDQMQAKQDRDWEFTTGFSNVEVIGNLDESESWPRQWNIISDYAILWVISQLAFEKWPKVSKRVTRFRFLILSQTVIITRAGIVFISVSLDLAHNMHSWCSGNIWQMKCTGCKFPSPFSSPYCSSVCCHLLVKFLQKMKDLTFCRSPFLRKWTMNSKTRLQQP